MTSTVPYRAAGAHDDRTIDFSATAAVPFSRLVRAELRKMYDTRSGFWLLVATGLTIVAAVGSTILTVEASRRTFGEFVAATSYPLALVLGILGVLLVTSEWSQRTAQITFALEPHRARAVGAKIAAASLTCAVALVFALALAAAVASVAGAADPFADLTWKFVLGVAINQFGGLGVGLGFGMLFLAAAPAIVAYFAVPIGVSLIVDTWSALASHKAWLDIGVAMLPLNDPSAQVSGEQWSQILVTVTTWVIAPFLIGLVRMLRAEIR